MVETIFFPLVALARLNESRQFEKELADCLEGLFFLGKNLVEHNRQVHWLSEQFRYIHNFDQKVLLEGGHRLVS